MFIDKVIGTGYVAIADERSSNPTKEELARIAHMAGKLKMQAPSHLIFEKPPLGSFD